MVNRSVAAELPAGLRAYLQRIARTPAADFDIARTLIELINYAASSSGSRSAYLKRTGGDPGGSIIACSEIGGVIAIDGNVASCNISVIDEGIHVATLVLLRDASSPTPTRDQFNLLDTVADLCGLALRRSGMDEEIGRNQRALRDTVDAKYHLLGAVSLNLKNSLSVAAGYLQLLDMEEVGDQHQYAKKGRRAIDSAVGLINELVALARAEAGDLSVELDTVDISPFIRDAVANHEQDVVHKRIMVNSEPTPRVPTVYTDPNLIRDILEALVSNAVKYTPEAGVITIRTEVREGRRTSDPSSWVCVTIHDSGPGVADADHIFEEARRVEGPRKQMGFRLVICRRVARLLGGDLTLESAPRRGSAFTLWLPLPRARA